MEDMNVPEAFAAQPVVKRGPGRPSWKPDPVTGLILGKYTKEEWNRRHEEARKRRAIEREAAANAKIQEVEVTQGPNGVRVKFMGQWDAEEKASLISDIILRGKPK